MWISAIFIVICAASNSQAAVIFSNFGPGDSYDALTGWTTSLNNDVGMAFIPIGNDFLLERIELAGSLTGGCETDVWFMSGDINPDTIIETFHHVGPLNGIISMDSSLHPILKADTQYWVVASFSQECPLGELASWYCNSIGDKGPVAQGEYPSLSNSGNLVRGAFRITGTPIVPVTPSEGTIGTEIWIEKTSSSFGAKKGKVLIGEVALTVREWTGELIKCQLKRALSPGIYDVTIRPQGKGSSPVIIEDGFTVKIPEIDSVEPAIGSTGDNVTIHGFFFGTKKGKVTLGNKNCKILRWEMNPGTGESEIHFVVPKGLGDGTREVKVTNGVGTDTTYFTVGTDRATSFQYPMDPYVEGHRYFDEWTDNYGGKYHAAQDCGGKGGDPVYAVANGVISYSYGEGGEWRGYGYVMTIDHQLPDESWYYSLYGHLSTRRWKKEAGKPVYRGELIGYVGDDDEDGSSAWGPHLHFGIRVGKKSDYFDFLVGYYSDHPALHGWMNPGEFIAEH